MCRQTPPIVAHYPVESAFLGVESRSAPSMKYLNCQLLLPSRLDSSREHTYRSAHAAPSLRCCVPYGLVVPWVRPRLRASLLGCLEQLEEGDVLSQSLVVDPLALHRGAMLEQRDDRGAVTLLVGP